MNEIDCDHSLVRLLRVVSCAGESLVYNTSSSRDTYTYGACSNLAPIVSLLGVYNGYSEFFST